MSYDKRIEQAVRQYSSDPTPEHAILVAELVRKIGIPHNISQEHKVSEEDFVEKTAPLSYGTPSKDSLDKRFKEVEYFVEGSYFEAWSVWDREKRICSSSDGLKMTDGIETWKQDSRAHFITCGHFRDSSGKLWPVCITLGFEIINGIRICFYEATSMLVHYEIVEGYLDKLREYIESQSGHKPSKCNAMNIGHMYSYVREKSKKKSLK